MTFPYDRRKAVAYAKVYANAVCHDGFVVMRGQGLREMQKGTKIEFPLSADLDDSAHFISCCIGSHKFDGGGAFQGNEWKESSKAIYGFKSTRSLVDFLMKMSKGAVTALKTESDDTELPGTIEPGDLIAYYNTKEKIYSNVALFLDDRGRRGDLIGRIATHPQQHREAWNFLANYQGGWSSWKDSGWRYTLLHFNSDAEAASTTNRVAPNSSNAISREKQHFAYATVVSLQFETDHHLLRDHDADWKSEGKVFSKPEFTRDASRTPTIISHPISHTGYKPLKMKVTFQVKTTKPKDTKPVAVTIVGTPDPPWGFTFEAKDTFADGTCVVTATSSKKLPGQIMTLDGKIRWEIKYDEVDVAKPKTVTLPAGDSLYHTIFITWGTPVEEPMSVKEEVDNAGVTLKRMRAATARGNKMSPHEIASSLLQDFSPKTTAPTGYEPKYYRYINKRGGAWPMIDDQPRLGESQAVVRLAAAVLRQLGVPNADPVMVWADPRRGGGVGAQEDHLNLDFGRGGSAQGGPVAMLVRHPVGDPNVHHSNLGILYTPSEADLADRDEKNPRLYPYVACLRLNTDNQPKYYPCGAKVDSFKPGESFGTANDVLKRFFWGLIRVTRFPNGSYYVAEVIAKYSQREFRRDG